MKLVHVHGLQEMIIFDIAFLVLLDLTGELALRVRQVSIELGNGCFDAIGTKHEGIILIG